MAAANKSLNLFLQVVIYFNGWFDILFFLAQVALYIWKGSVLPYPDSLGGMLALEICLLFVFALLEYARIFLMSRGNKTESTTELVFAWLLSFPSAILLIYYQFWQVYVTRLDRVLTTIGEGFLLVCMILSLIVWCDLIGGVGRPTQASAS